MSSTVAGFVFWAAFCLFLGLGCGGNSAPELRHEPGACDRTFVVSSEFSSDERAALDRAVARWNAIAIEQFCLADSSESIDPSKDTRAIFRIPYKGDYWQRVSASLGGIDFIGIWWNTDLIGIVDSMPIDQFERVALHELGHAHGLRHTEAPSIMHASDGTAVDFTDKDIAECKRVGACASNVAAYSADDQPAVWVLER